MSEDLGIKKWRNP